MTAAMSTSGYEFTDIFCGAGGSSAGLAEAGLTLKLAANHWPQAIETHAANFTDADHLCADVNNYDMRRLPKTHILWASPICTEISPSGGRRRKTKQTAGQLALEEFGHVPQDAYERTRATFWDVIRATEVHRYPIVIIENVVEAATQWELFDIWLAAMAKLGYHHQVVSVSAAHVGDDEGNDPAPQWRDRMYVFLTRKDLTPPTISPSPRAWCFTCEKPVRAVQSWKRVDRPKIGKYGQQYVYRCPSVDCRHSIVEPFVLPAAAAIDWSDIGTRIGDRAKPLAAATMRRIRVGLELFAQPPFVDVARTHNRPRGIDEPLAPMNTGNNHNLVHPPFMLDRRDYHGSDETRLRGVDEPMGTVTAAGRTVRTMVTPPFIVDRRAYEDGDIRRVKPIDEPVGAITANGRPHTLVTPPAAMLAVNHGGDDARAYLADGRPLPTRSTKLGDGLIVPAGGTWNETAAPLQAPMRTRTTRDTDGLVVPALVGELRRNAAAKPADEAPLATMAASGNHHFLTTPDGAFIQKHHGGIDYPGVKHMVKGVGEPAPTMVARSNLSLVIPYRRGSKAARATGEPLSTVATVEQHGTAMAPVSDADVDDCYFRMLKPREHGRAQRFRDSYIVLGNGGEQTMQFGNAVPSNVAQWLGGIARDVLDGAK